MTREEEIRILQTAFEILDRMVKWYHGISHDLKIGENDIKALEVAKIAIEALQTQLKESPENFNKPSATESMLNADLISRQAALEQSIVLRDISNPDKEWEVVPVGIIKRLKPVHPIQKVIRCKDCKHYVPWDYDHYSYCAKSHLQHPVENCFCSYAEAKMEEGEANAE